MIRKILLLCSALAIAGAANAQSIRVSLAGKSDKQVRAAVLQAAVAACNATQSPLDGDLDVESCISNTYQDALQQARAVRARELRRSTVASR